MLVMHGQNLSDEEWRNHYFEKKTQRKRKRNSGQAYINAVGKLVSAKSMQVVNCTKCRFHCSENFSEEKRLQIFTQYYALADYSRQKDFLASHIVEASPKRLGSSTGPLKHRVARGYYLPIDGARKRVCGDFFCKTLDLNLSLCKVLMGEGNMCQKIKKSEWQLNLIRQHINSYFRMESHYCRQTTKRQYLDSSLSVAKMYEQFVLYYHQQLQLENQREGGTCLVTQHSGGGAALDGENSVIIPADKF